MAWSLARREQLLGQVQRLATSLNVVGDVGYTCETAEYFFLQHVQSRIEKYEMDVEKVVAAGASADNQTREGAGVAGTSIKDVFPFGSYFADAPQQPNLFIGKCSRFVLIRL